MTQNWEKWGGVIRDSLLEFKNTISTTQLGQFESSQAFPQFRHPFPSYLITSVPNRMKLIRLLNYSWTFAN